MDAPTTILRIRKVIERTGLSRATIHRKIKRGEFPAPVILGVNSRGWIEDEVAAWIASRPRAGRPESTSDTGPQPAAA